MRLYDLLPSIVRANDLQKGEVLSKLFEAYEEVTDTVSQDILELISLASTLQVPLPFLPFLSYLVGHTDIDSTSEVYRRWSLGSAVSSHKKKGTLFGWKKHYKRTTGSPISVVELFKNTLLETGQYSQEQDGSHLLPSARVLLGPCETSCETGSEVNFAGSDEALSLLKHLRPIHVLTPLNLVTGEASDEFLGAEDTLGCSSACETGEEAWSGSVVRSVFSDQFSSGEDELEIKLSCVTGCQISCQGCCEIDCEQSRCQLKCEVSCETSCTVSCEDYCQACNEVVCAKSCEVHCQDPCEGFCEMSCQGSCQAHECQAYSMQWPVARISCELGVEELVEYCQFACMIYACTFSCTGTEEVPDEPFCQLDSCQGACEYACIFGCTGGCQGGACEAGVAQGMTYTHTGESCNRCRATVGRIVDYGIGEPEEIGQGVIFAASSRSASIFSQSDTPPLWTSNTSPPHPPAGFSTAYPEGRCGTLKSTPDKHWYMGYNTSTAAMELWFYDGGTWAQMDTSPSSGFDSAYQLRPHTSGYNFRILVPDGDNGVYYFARRTTPSGWGVQHWNGSSWTIITTLANVTVFPERFKFFFSPARWCWLVDTGPVSLEWYENDNRITVPDATDETLYTSIAKQTPIPSASYTSAFIRDAWFERNILVLFLNYSYAYGPGPWDRCEGFATVTFNSESGFEGFALHIPGIHWEWDYGGGPQPDWPWPDLFYGSGLHHSVVTASGSVYVVTGAYASGGGYLFKQTSYNPPSVSQVMPTHGSFRNGSPYYGFSSIILIYDRYFFVPGTALVSPNAIGVYDTTTETWLDGTDYQLIGITGWLGSLVGAPGETAITRIEDYWDKGALVPAQKGTHYGILFYEWLSTWDYLSTLVGDQYNKLPYRHARGWKQIPVDPPYPQVEPYQPNDIPSGFCAYGLTKVFGNGKVLAHAMCWTSATVVTSWIYDGDQWVQVHQWSGYFDNTGALYNQVVIPVNRFTLNGGEFYLVTSSHIFTYSGGNAGSFTQEFILFDKDIPGVEEHWTAQIDKVTNEYPTMAKQAAVYNDNWAVFGSPIKLTQGYEFNYYGFRFIFHYRGNWYDQSIDFRYNVSGAPATTGPKNIEVLCVALNREGHGYFIIKFNFAGFSAVEALWEINLEGYLQDDNPSSPSDETHKWFQDDPTDVYSYLDIGSTAGPFTLVGAFIDRDEYKESTALIPADQSLFPNLAMKYETDEIRCMTNHGGYLYVGVGISAFPLDIGQPFGSTSEIFRNVGVVRAQLLPLDQRFEINLGGGASVEAGFKWVFVGPPADMFGYEHYSQYYSQVAKTPPTPPGGVSVDKYPEAAGYYAGGTRDGVAPHAMITEETGDMGRGLIYEYFQTGWLMFFPRRGGSGRFMYVKLPYYSEADPFYYRNLLLAWLHPQLLQI